MRRGTELRALLDLLQGVRHKGRTHTAHRVVGRGVDGVEILQAIEGACPIRGSLGTQALGAVSLAPVTSLARVSGLPTVAVLTGGVLRLESQDPPVLVRGQTQAVTLTGVALPEGLAFDYLQPGVGPGGQGRVHPGVHVVETERLAPTTYRLVVQVDPDTPLLSDAPIAYGQGQGGDPVGTGDTTLEHRAERFYGIAPPDTPPAFVAYAFDGSDLIVGQYAADGTPLAPLGQVSRPSWDPLWATPLWVLGPGALALTDGYRVDVIDLAGESHSTSDFTGTAVSVAYVEGAVHWITLGSGSGTSVDVHLYRAPLTLDPVELVGTGSHTAAALAWGDAAYVAWDADRVHVARRYTSPQGERAALVTLTLFGWPISGSTGLELVGTGWPSTLGPLRSDVYLVTGGEDGAVWSHWPPPSWPVEVDGLSVDGGPSASGTTACLVRGGRLLAGPLNGAPPTTNVELGPSPEWPWPSLIFPLEPEP